MRLGLRAYRDQPGKPWPTPPEILTSDAFKSTLLGRHVGACQDDPQAGPAHNRKSSIRRNARPCRSEPAMAGNEPEIEAEV